MGRFSDTKELQRRPESLAPVSSRQAQSAHTTLERILEVVCFAPVDGPFDDTMRWALTAFSDILPGYSLGLRIASIDGAPPLLVCVPPGSQPPELAPSGELVMFPDLPHERVVPLSCRPHPSSLHCAADDPNLESPDSAVGHVVRWCAEALCTIVRHADSAHAAHALEHETARLREAIAHTQKLASLGQLSAGLIHDMSNPLTSIAVYAEYLQRKMSQRDADPDDVLRVQRIAEAADVVLSLVRAIKSYARPSHDPPFPIDARTVVDQAVRFCSHVIDASHVEVQVQQGLDLPLLNGIASELIQVFVNLISNACEALSPNGGVVTIGIVTDPARSNVVFTVSDSGPGIAQEHLQRVFEPFFTTRHDTGTGLGLAIVRQIVNKHHGSVTVQSVPGHGCTFTVVLPSAATTSP